MRRLLATLLLATLPCTACIWDRDTLKEAAEADGKLDTVKSITGWFNRYPPLYYEMRLERISADLAADPKALELYDDAGVACDRLGRYDEAIRWMEKKKALIDTLPADQTKTARYRHLANLGSFLGNRWATRPADQRKADPADLNAAIKSIEEAIQLDPDAHLGREKYQLQLFQWLAAGYNDKAQEEDKKLWNFLAIAPGGATQAGGPGEAKFREMEKGIASLIQLGSAWENLDVFAALGAVLNGAGANTPSLLASLRVEELKKSGRSTLYPVPERVNAETGINAGDFKLATAWYFKTRLASQKRNLAWLVYQKERFAKGEHPDTHPDFWKAWQEPAFPALPEDE
ncbi:hypothetical protein [Luteolibacter sp. Populi]|uniref:hypothetical protein n=1 Tax=Luteolibacter sp. Populi TaxID=3230487 RepID=UPI003466119C